MSRVSEGLSFFNHLLICWTEFKYEVFHVFHIYKYVYVMSSMISKTTYPLWK